MQRANIRLFAIHFWRNATTHNTFYVLYTIFILLTAYSAVSGINNFITQNNIRQEHQEKARQSWEANPDKHPHRMAHFGTFAFRQSANLAIFDTGIESYTGNAIFLEAHKQNSVNFSEATFSTGALRFGELNLALLLQLLLPLILFFIGFASVAADKQNGTLRIILSQGASWKEILIGKSLGLFTISLLFLIPVFLVVLAGLLFLEHISATASDWLRYFIILGGYLIFLFIISFLTVIISANSNNSKDALLRLLGIWLIMVVLLPKTTQALGNYYFPTPTKLAFESAIEEEVITKGDSHDPNDPHYRSLRDSVLAANKVTKIEDLPFNYGGFIMKEGERITSTLYNKHHQKLINTYKNQNDVTKYSSLINPFEAMKQVSMILSGTDFISYLDFQKQADTYRYNLAQTMNQLQMDYISPSKTSGSEGKTHVVNHKHWEEFKDFKHRPTVINKSINEAIPALIALLLWGLLITLLLQFISKRAKAI